MKKNLMNSVKMTSSKDLQGSHWAPHLIHKDLWNSVGGFSEDYNPGDGSDPDFCMKLWNKNVRVLKQFQNSRYIILVL